MAGIIVSGGTFSGSGDMTTDYIFVYSGSYIAGDGTTSVIGTATHPSAGSATAFSNRYWSGGVGGTFDANGGTFSFSGPLQQFIRGVANGTDLTFYNLITSGGAYLKQLRDISLVVGNDLTILDASVFGAESVNTGWVVSYKKLGQYH